MGYMSFVQWSFTPQGTELQIMDQTSKSRLWTSLHLLPWDLKYRGNWIDSWANLKHLNYIPITCSGVQTLSTFAKAMECSCQGWGNLDKSKGGKKDKSWKQTKPEKAADKPDGIKDSSFSWRHKGGKEPQEEKKIDKGPPICSRKKEK